jgi:hypothetical protein
VTLILKEKRDISDFERPVVKALTPEDFLNMQEIK